MRRAAEEALRMAAAFAIEQPISKARRAEYFVAFLVGALDSAGKGELSRQVAAVLSGGNDASGSG